VNGHGGRGLPRLISGHAGDQMVRSLLDPIREGLGRASWRFGCVWFERWVVSLSRRGWGRRGGFEES